MDWRTCGLCLDSNSTLFWSLSRLCFNEPVWTTETTLRVCLYPVTVTLIFSVCFFFSGWLNTPLISRTLTYPPSEQCVYSDLSKPSTEYPVSKHTHKHTHFPQKICVLQTSGVTHALVHCVSDFSGCFNAKPQKHPHVSAPTPALSNPR